MVAQVDYYTQNFCNNYAYNFFKNGMLDFDLVDKYGAKFGLSKNDFKGNETVFQIAQKIYEQQIKNEFNGTDPIKKGYSQKKFSIFLEKDIKQGTNNQYTLNTVNREFFDTQNRKLKIIS